MNAKNQVLINSMLALKCELPSDSRLQKYLTEEIVKLLNRVDCPENSLTEEEISVGRNEGKLPCISLYKNRTGASLLESKKFVESVFQKYNLKFKQDLT